MRRSILSLVAVLTMASVSQAGISTGSQYSGPRTYRHYHYYNRVPPAPATNIYIMPYAPAYPPVVPPYYRINPYYSVPHYYSPYGR